MIKMYAYVRTVNAVLKDARSPLATGRNSPYLHNVDYPYSHYKIRGKIISQSIEIKLIVGIYCMRVCHGSTWNTSLYYMPPPTPSLTIQQIALDAARKRVTTHNQQLIINN